MDEKPDFDFLGYKEHENGTYSREKVVDEGHD